MFNRIKNIGKFILLDFYRIHRYIEFVGLENKNKHCLLRGFIRWRLRIKYGIFIGESTQIGKGIQVPHPFGIVIGNGVIIGSNVVIYQHVTIGVKNRSNTDVNTAYAIIEDNVCIYAGAKILGNIIVGENSIIGANAVLLNSVPANSCAVGIPAKVLLK